MLFVFLAGSLALVIVYSILSRTIFPRMRQVRSNRRLMRGGAEAEAIILRIERTGRYIDNEPMVKLLLKVQPVTRLHFVTEIREVITVMDLSQLRTGTMLKVRYNPANTREVMLVRK